MSVKKEWSAETMEKTEQQLRVIRRGAAEILPLEDLREKLARSIEENRPLKIRQLPKNFLASPFRAGVAPRTIQRCF